MGNSTGMPNPVGSGFGVDKTRNSSVKDKRGTTNLGIDEFLKLIVAQMQNQDMLNPMKDTDFIAQMASFTTLEVMSNNMKMNSKAYALSMLGKEVVIKARKDSGEVYKKKDVVTEISYEDKDPVLTVDGKKYLLENVKTVING